MPIPTPPSPPLPKPGPLGDKVQPSKPAKPRNGIPTSTPGVFIDPATGRYYTDLPLPK